MAIDPSIALQIRPPQDMMQSLSQIYALKNAGQQQQLNQQQIQQGQYQLDAAGRAQADDAATRAAFSGNTQVDPATGAPTLNRAGALSQLYKTAPTAALKYSQQFTQQDIANQKAAGEYQKTQLENAKAHVDFVGQLLQGVKDQPSYTAALQTAMHSGIVKPGEFPPVYDPSLVQQHLSNALTQKDAIAQKLKEQEFAQRTQNDQATRDQTATRDAETAKYHGVEAGLRKQEIGIQGGRLGVERQKVAISKGDPNAAAQLLVDGDATLSELKARGSTPEFIAQTLKAARDLSGGKYNAQSSEAQFAVAKSPANVAFFGSAGSLIDKGGTLDQLAAAAKDIPGGKIPAFNSIEDWQKAASGSGPIAKYASIALGVADDYAKVMGGGQGSDSSRSQALKLVGAAQSPEQRAGSIGGIRGSVGSQKNSRIGKNKILERMYGEEAPADAPAGGAGVTAPDGSTAYTSDGVTYHIPKGEVGSFLHDHKNARKL